MRESECQGAARKKRLEKCHGSKNVSELGCENLCLRKHCSVLEAMCSMISLVLTGALVIWQHEICYQE